MSWFRLVDHRDSKCELHCNSVWESSGNYPRKLSSEADSVAESQKFGTVTGRIPQNVDFVSAAGRWKNCQSVAQLGRSAN